jgi:hypothetical protein
MTRHKDTTVGNLRNGDTVQFKNDERVLTIRKVWRYEDGSITLEFKGKNPGMWRYAGDALNLTVTVRT